ncbi:hypothetical protein EUGRSUZ_G01054 [Eucalyptus grandis]|uniref:Uncharacterized protein n=2 Tax=Eucalyptus grandis TaxID=71139 RepID=A0ACC3K1I5_EUCGR|nr:hypothetical protein EUGRSUZ_G01054 [Eucalyptus grandis]
MLLPHIREPSWLFPGHDLVATATPVATAHVTHPNQPDPRVCFVVPRRFAPILALPTNSSEVIELGQNSASIRVTKIWAREEKGTRSFNKGGRMH